MSSFGPTLSLSFFLTSSYNKVLIPYIFFFTYQFLSNYYSKMLVCHFSESKNTTAPLYGEYDIEICPENLYL